MPRWLPLESNPEVMNKYIAALGVAEPTVEMVDVYGVTEEMLCMVPHPVYAVMLVYTITKDTEAFLKQLTDSQRDEVEAFRKAHKFFYTKQYVDNACGTIGVLHALLNNYPYLGKIEEGSFLDMHHAGLMGMSPEEAGEAIAVDKSVATAHAVAAEEGATQPPDLHELIDLHFVTFVRIGDRCVELDGRQANPILHGGACGNEAEFLTAAAAAIEQRMSLNPNSHNYAITALVGNAE